jgi:hypothetical protein
MVKAIARAFRWRNLLENGTYGSIAEISAAEKINASYVARVFRLTLLAPDLVEGILNGDQPQSISLVGLMAGFPHVWDEQRQLFRCLPTHDRVTASKRAFRS